MPPLTVGHSHSNGGRIEEALDRYSRKQRDRIVDGVARKYGLSDADRERVFAALTEVENAKAKEFWEKRGPMEALVLVGRTAVGTGLTVASGLVAPSSAFFPAVMSSLIGLGAQLAVLYRKLGHALHGRAAVEISRISQERDQKPITPKRGRLRRIVERWAARVVEKYSKRYGLDEAQRAAVATKVEEAAVFKQKELWEKRLPVEIGATIGASVVSAIAGVALGLVAAPGIGALALSALFGSLISIGLSVRKLRANLEATAYAEVQELAQDQPGSSVAREVGKDERPGERSAVKAAERVTKKYAARFGLSSHEQEELNAILESLARLKEKELVEHRLLPTLVAPIARGGSVAAVASMMGIVGPPTATALLIAAIAESAASGLILYKSLNPALEGAAYAYALERTEESALPKAVASLEDGDALNGRVIKSHAASIMLLAGFIGSCGMELVGGWTASCNGQPGLYACFSSDEFFAAGDRPEEPADGIREQRSTWSDDGTITRSDGQREGSWKLDGDTLTLTFGDSAEPCPIYFCDPEAMTVGSDFCGAHYQKSELPDCP